MKQPRDDESVTGTTITDADGNERRIEFERPVSVWRAMRLRDEAIKTLARGEALKPLS